MVAIYFYAWLHVESLSIGVRIAVGRLKPYKASLLPEHMQRWERLLTNQPAKNLAAKTKAWLGFVKKALYTLLGSGKKVASLEIFFKQQFGDDSKSQRLTIVLFFIESINSIFGKALMERCEIELPDGMQPFRINKIFDVANCLVCGASRAAANLEKDVEFINESNWASQQPISICGDDSCKTQLYEKILPIFRDAVDGAASFGAQLLALQRARTTEQHLDKMFLDIFPKVEAAYEHWLDNYRLVPLSDGSERRPVKPRYTLDRLARYKELPLNISRISKEIHPLFGSRIFQDVQGKKIAILQSKEGKPIDIETGEALDASDSISHSQLDLDMNKGQRALRRKKR